ncbi:MAG: sadH, partial [Pedosphaera sp.]|nr:sadH [Pedosphaera sp.]
MPRRIADSVVVITGASSGIARATALEIADHHGTVVLASRQEKALQEVASECERRGGKALPIRTDVTDEQQVQTLARRTVETFGRIDVWINAAAVALYSGFEEAPPDAFRRVIETNLFG